MTVWNPWHGCRKISPGCLHCYMFRRDASVGKNSLEVCKTADFDLPVKKTRSGDYKLREEGVVYCCMTSDFFLEEADEWRKEAWAMIRERSDLRFYIITKRIERFYVSLPDDWGAGYPNVTVCSTCENNETAGRRLPVLLSLPVARREIIHEPMLGPVDIEEYLASGKIARVICGGESGDDARVCNYDWVLDVRRQCRQYRVPFYFKQTGARFMKDGCLYRIARKDQITQARKAGIDLSYP